MSPDAQTNAAPVPETWEALTICLISYNLDGYLRAALDGLVSQTVRPGECIILDDASTDNSWSLICDYGKRHPWLRIIRNETNLGVHGNSNKGLTLAQREFFYCASADDFIHPNFVAEARRLHALAPAARILFGATARITEAGEPIAVRRASRLTPDVYHAPAVFKRDFIDAEPAWFALSPSTIYSRADLNRVGGLLPEIGPWADTIAIWACGMRGGAIYSDQVWTTFRCRPGSYSSRSSTDLVKTVQMAGAAKAALLKLGEFAPLCRDVSRRQPFQLYLAVCLVNLSTLARRAVRQTPGATFRALAQLASIWTQSGHVRAVSRLFSARALASFAWGCLRSLFKPQRRS